MKEFFKSKFFYVITVLTLIAVIVPTVLVSMGHTPILRSAVNTVLIPIQKLSDKAAGVIDGYASYFRSFDKMKAENAKLKEELASLREQIYEAREMKEKYEWMSEFLELKMVHIDYHTVPASITGRGSTSYAGVFMLDVGTVGGVGKGMPVVSGEGILGYITEVGPNWSKASSFLEESSAVGAYVERSGVIGVVEGNYNLAREGLCRMSYLDEGADIKVGDRILTSGYGSIYPRSLTVGYVEKVEPDEFSRGVTAYIRPVTTLDQVSKVMVVTGYDEYTE